MSSYSDLKNRRVTAYLDDESDREYLRTLAHKRGSTMSKVAAELLAAALKRERTKETA